MAPEVHFRVKRRESQVVAHVMKDERIAITTNMDEAPDLALEIRLAVVR